MGAGVPTSCGDPGFVPDASCEQLTDGTILSWLEERRYDDDDGLYEVVRILVAHRHGRVVTLNS